MSKAIILFCVIMYLSSCDRSTEKENINLESVSRSKKNFKAVNPNSERISNVEKKLDVNDEEIKEILLDLSENTSASGVLQPNRSYNLEEETKKLYRDIKSGKTKQSQSLTETSTVANSATLQPNKNLSFGERVAKLKKEVATGKKVLSQSVTDTSPVPLVTTSESQTTKAFSGYERDKIPTIFAKSKEQIASERIVKETLRKED